MIFRFLIFICVLYIPNSMSAKLIGAKFISPEMATDVEVANAVATKVFGNNFKSAYSLEESSTTSNTNYSTKVLIETDNLPLGSYIVMANYVLKAGSNKAATVRLMDGNTELKSDAPYISSSADHSARSLTYVLENVSGVRNIKLEFKSGNSDSSSQNSTTTLSQTSLIFWRVF